MDSRALDDRLSHPPSLALAPSLSAAARLRLRMNTVWNRFVNEMGWRCIAVQLPLSFSLSLSLSFDRSSWMEHVGITG